MKTNRLLPKIFIVYLFACIILINGVQADEIIISNHTTETTIQWDWTNTSLTGVENISIDGYKLCNFDPHSTKFILSDLEPKTSHEIIIYSNLTSKSQTAITKENLLSFLIAYYIIQIIGLIIVIISLSNRIVILAWLGVFITSIGFIITMPESISNYFFILTNGVLLLFTIIIALVETRQ